MKISLRAALIVSAIALAACAQKDGTDMGAGSDQFGTGGFENGGISSSALDPASTEYFAQTVGDRVLFPVDQSSLTADARLILDGQVAWLQRNGSYQIVIEGHADEQGTREYNVALGARRANAVKEYLVSQGVDASRLRTVSYGKERPISVCSSETCYSQNRRAVTALRGAGS